MNEEERKLIAVIVGVLVGTANEPAIVDDLKWATEQAGFTPEYLSSILDEATKAHD